MTRIGLLSDTHGFLNPLLQRSFSTCDEIWHCGDFGNAGVARELEGWHPLKGVYGNIDDREIRNRFPEKLLFNCEEVKVLMVHIGGYPKKYARGIRKIIKENNIDLFITGHSHILKIVYDNELSCLHINPGAAGRQGWHHVCTAVKFEIDGKAIRECQIVEFNRS